MYMHFLSLLPFHGNFASHPIHQNDSASLLGEDRPGMMKLSSNMLCCWHDMGPVVKAEEYYHTL